MSDFGVARDINSDTGDRKERPKKQARMSDKDIKKRLVEEGVDPQVLEGIDTPTLERWIKWKIVKLSTIEKPREKRFHLVESR